MTLRIFHLATIILAALATINATATTINAGNQNTGHRAFSAGEDLTYSVKYAFIKGGEARFTVTDTVINGRKTEHIICGGKTTGVADAFYKVRDSYESYFDTETQMPVMAKRNIKEGRYFYNDICTFNRTDNTVLMHKNTRHGQKDSTFTLPPYTHDIVGAFYHARNNMMNRNLNIGDTIQYNTFFGGELFPLKIRLAAIETIKTKMGKIECFRFTPVTEVGRSFDNEDGMSLWISTSSARIPVKVKFDLAVGSFTFELTNYKGIKKD